MLQWKPVAKRSAASFHSIRNAVCAAVIGSSLLGFGVPALATITGVCPDGSIFIVQRISAIPCTDAKQVEPNDVPPLNPELLPRPYGWQQFQGRQDPNNPYNVVDSAPSVRRVGRSTRRGPRDQQPVRGQEEEDRGLPTFQTFQPEAESAELESVGERPDDASFQSARVNPLSAANASATPSRESLVSWFSSRDLHDLALIVELSQRHAPATFSPVERGEPSGLTLRIAHSASFEPRLRALMQSRGGLPPGSVVLFSVTASDPQPFFGNLTFVQGGVVYYPKPGEVSDFGILRGALGMVGVDEVLLGYARLPEGIDLTRGLDVYWNDRLISALLDPS